MDFWRIEDVADVGIWNRGVRVIGLGDDVAMAPREALAFAAALIEAANAIFGADEERIWGAD